MGSVLTKELIEAAKRGERQAWKALIEATQSRLYKFCFVLCGDPVRAEDLCQQAYLRTYDNLGKLNQPEAFMSWLLRMTRNLYIDELRSTREQADGLGDDTLGTTEGQGELSDHIEVHRVLSQFEPEDRILLLLIDMEEYSYREAATVLGLSEDTVRSRLFRIRKEFLEKWNGRETK